MKNDHVKLPELKDADWTETGLESAHTLFNIIGSAFPIIGPMITTPLGWEITKLRDRRLREFIDENQKYLQRLPKMISASEEIRDVINLNLSKFINAPSKKKGIY